MPDHDSANPPSPPVPPAATAVAERAPAKAPPERKALPPYRVLLHNDDVNTFEHVVETLVELTPLNVELAATCALEAHEKGLSLVTVTHRERAELFMEQLVSKGLSSTIEPVA